MSIANQLIQLSSSIIAAECKYNRPAGCVRLLAVSKGQANAAIREAYAAGQRDFGENYVQEAVDKINALRDLAPTWHFIGHLQANKTRLVAEQFSWVHSIDSLKIAQRLAAQRPAHLPPLQCCIQVNIDGDPNKGGIKLDALSGLALAFADFKALHLRGLMTISQQYQQMAQQRAVFAQLVTAFDDLKQRGFPDLDTLSMGMSHDYLAAIAAGATCIRIGSKIFGERNDDK